MDACLLGSAPVRQAREGIKGPIGSFKLRMTPRVVLDPGVAARRQAVRPTGELGMTLGIIMRLIRI